MTTDDDRGSLADAAAAWVPPWERPKPETSEPSPEPEPSAEPDTVPQSEIFSEPETDSSAGGEPEPASPETAGPEGGAEEQIDTAAEGTDDSAAAGTDAVAAPGEVVEPEVASPGSVTAEPSSAPAVPTQKSKPGTAEAEAAGGEKAAPKRRRAKPKPAEPEPDPVSLIDDAELRGALEAILLVVDEPVAEVMLSQVLEQPTERVTQMLYLLSGEYTDRGHGFDLRRVAGGWRLYTRPEYAAYVERFVLDGQTARLTQAALETLAVVAYKQPCSRSQVSAIRGVNCDGVMRTLVTRGLVEECGADVSGAYLYKTTTLFLEKLGIDSVAQLPPLAPFLPDNVEEIVTDA
ncbi:segregation and condensation protein B [Catenuloplanes nepalensis]|uniref:Segregation and condensation protein B n=1 Tax=Catenuloplanes nepalensis TaxID=587533 RepID=A0ABT9MWR2_9ACTN|nr:SMC-Scp complex subunit ScpB [Catenuloplanes nepalensis]MDP9795884.1 segregation and condensation protein B [Catenuloplanes nepalensis]